VDLCADDTGASVDAWITAPLEVVTRCWLGEMSWAQFVRRPDVDIEGNRVVRREMQRWLQRYVFADA
jgi:hypothetical protein